MKSIVTLRKEIFFILCNFFLLQKNIAQVKILTYEEAVATALNNNLELKQFENGIRVNKAQFNSNKLNFLPEIYATLDGAKTKGFQFSTQEQSLVDEEIETLDFNLEADFVLFNGFKKLNNLKRSKSLLEAKKNEFYRLQQDIVLQTTQKYFQYLLDQEVLKVSKENLNINKQIFSRVVEQVKLGQKPGLDSISQRVVLENSKLNVQSANNRLTNDKLDLLNLLVLNDTENITFQPFIENKKKPFKNDLQELNNDRLIDNSYKQRHDLKQLNDEKEAFKKSINISRSVRYPIIGLYYNYGSAYISNRRRQDANTNEYVDVNFRNQFLEENIVNKYGFYVSIPILANYTSRKNIVEAKVNYENKEYEIENLKRLIANDIENAINNFEQLSKSYDLAKKTTIASDFSLEKQRELYKLGLGDLIALNLEVQRNLSANSQEIRAKYRLYLQSKIIEYIIGELEVANIE